MSIVRLYMLFLPIWGVAALVSIGVVELVDYSKSDSKGLAVAVLTIAIAAPVCALLAGLGYVR